MPVVGWGGVEAPGARGDGEGHQLGVEVEGGVEDGPEEARAEARHEVVVEDVDLPRTGVCE